MKFEDYTYERISITKLQNKIDSLLTTLSTSHTYEQFYETFKQIDNEFLYVDSMLSLASIRFTVNTNDAFYSQEQDYWDENSPYIQELDNKVTKAVLQSKYVEQLKQDIPETYFILAAQNVKLFDPSIVSDLQQENRLQSKYQKVIAEAEIEFAGKTYTLASLGAKLDDIDESVRKGACEAYWQYFSDHEEEIDAIYDALVKVRDTMAKKLGFKNYVDLAYVRMHRMDYGRKEVEVYRKKILEVVVPFASKLYEQQKQRLQVDKLDVYNTDFLFMSGNPTPKASAEEMIELARQMYQDFSPKTGAFFDYMIEHNLMDLVAKPGKAAGGYCTYIPEYVSPYIFSNFNGTYGDVHVLTHEAGHAFQVYSSCYVRPSACIWPTMESAEIHSMSMEFLTWPWMESFFKEDTNKFYYLHLVSAITFLPYGALVDHFQEEIYSDISMSPSKRKEVWRKLEKQYLPEKNYDAIPLLEKGTWWYKQGHIFTSPFYYIDYTLAQVCALQYWMRKQENDPNVLHDYFTICNLGGTLPFQKIVKEGNIKVPFDDKCLEEVIDYAKEFLANFDQKQLQ